jgi:hypothetical protein
VPAGIWTQSVFLSWRRPSLRYYEHRINYLREVEDAGLLRAFRLSELDEVEARLAPRGHELKFSPTSIEVDVLGPEPAWDVCDPLVSRAVALIDPPEVKAYVMYQLLCPVDLSFEEAIEAAAATWFGRWAGTDSVKLTDHALLIDGQPAKSDDSYQAEFGIVKSGEIPRRLSRRAGRTHSPARSLPSDWEWTGLPETAIFIDFRYGGKYEKAPDDIESWLIDVRKRAASQAVDLSDLLEDSLLHADDRNGKVEI